MGTMIHAHEPSEEDYRGSRFRNHDKPLKNCTEIMVLTQPRMIEDIHRAYLEAGADIIATDSFNASGISMADYDLQEHVPEINRRAAEIARRAADDFTRRNPDKPRFVAGSIGPTNKTLYISPDVNDPGFRTVTFDEMVAAYTEQVHGLVAGGVDMLLAETAYDTLNLKACLFAIDKYFAEHTHPAAGDGVRHDLSDGGRTLSAQTVEAFWTSVSHFDMLSVGINCARRRGPDAALGREPVRDRAGLHRVAIPTPACPTAWAASDDSLERTAKMLGEFAAQRLGQHRRRLLRHHARAHPGDCPGSGGRQTARFGRSCRAGPGSAAPNRWWSGPKPTSS